MRGLLEIETTHGSNGNKIDDQSPPWTNADSFANVPIT